MILPLEVLDYRNNLKYFDLFYIIIHSNYFIVSYINTVGFNVKQGGYGFINRLLF